MSSAVIEQVRRLAPLGLELIDAASGRRVGDGLVVRVAPVGRPQRVVIADANPSGIFVAHDLPGLGDWSHGGDEPLPHPEYDIGIDDRLGRFLPCRLRLALPAACASRSRPPDWRIRRAAPTSRFSRHRHGSFRAWRRFVPKSSTMRPASLPRGRLSKFATLGVPPRQAGRLLCCQRARIHFRAGQLDAHFNLNDHPIAIRLAGLDRDPGWMPAAACDIRFCYDGNIVE